MLRYHQGLSEVPGQVLGYLQIVSEVLCQVNKLLLEPLQLCVPFCYLFFQTVQLLLKKYSCSNTVRFTARCANSTRRNHSSRVLTVGVLRIHYSDVEFSMLGVQRSEITSSTDTRAALSFCNSCSFSCRSSGLLLSAHWRMPACASAAYLDIATHIFGPSCAASFS